jgi:hypothetical protein
MVTKYYHFSGVTHCTIFLLQGSYLLFETFYNPLLCKGVKLADRKSEKSKRLTSRDTIQELGLLIMSQTGFEIKTSVLERTKAVISK